MQIINVSGHLKNRWVVDSEQQKEQIQEILHKDIKTSTKVDVM